CVDVLVAMNPAALKTNLKDVEAGGVVIANSDAFTCEEWQKAGFSANPLEDGTLAAFRLVSLPVNRLNREAVTRLNLSPREADRSRNFFALGLVFWMFETPLDPTLQWIRAKFAKNPGVLEANSRALKAGHHYGESAGVMPPRFHLLAARPAPGKYRQ